MDVVYFAFSTGKICIFVRSRRPEEVLCLVCSVRAISAPFGTHDLSDCSVSLHFHFVDLRKSLHYRVLRVSSLTFNAFLYVVLRLLNFSEMA